MTTDLDTIKHLSPEEIEELQQRFVTMLLDPAARYTKMEICRKLGLSLDLYDQWARDDQLLTRYSVESWRDEVILRNRVFRSQVHLVGILEDIAMDPKSGPFNRVQAIKTLSEIAKELRDRTPMISDEEGSGREREQKALDAAVALKELLSSHQPLFVDGKVIDPAYTDPLTPNPTPNSIPGPYDGLGSDQTDHSPQSDDE